MSDTENGNDPRRILTPEFRVSYEHVFKPSVMKGTNNAPKFSITMLFDKKTDLSTIKLALKCAKMDEWGDKESWPDPMRSPVLDGDAPKYAGKEGYAGCWVIKATSMEEAKPGVFDEDGKEIINQKLFYSGCYARAQIWSRAYNTGGNVGVQFILDGVQKTREGKPFSARAALKFDPIAGGKKKPAASEMEDDADF